MDYKTVGRRIAVARKFKGITQEQLAERLDVSINTIYNMEKGVTKSTLSTIVRVVNLLDCTVDSLLDGFLWHKDNVIPSDIDQVIAHCSEPEWQFFLRLLEATNDIYLKWHAK